MRLIVVEDDPLVGPAMAAVLERAGHTVLGVATTVPKALRLAANGLPDLAIVDLQLAGGADGLVAVRLLRERYRVPSLVVTAYEHRAREAAPHALGYLAKPVMPERLLAGLDAVAALLDGRAPAAVPRGLELFVAEAWR